MRPAERLGGPTRLIDASRPASKPPRIAHEDQRAGEVPSAVLAGLQVQHARLAIRAQPDRHAQGELARTGRESHAGIEGNGIPRPAEAGVAAANQIADGLAVDPATETEDRKSVV